MERKQMYKYVIIAIIGLLIGYCIGWSFVDSGNVKVEQFTLIEKTYEPSGSCILHGTKSQWGSTVTGRIYNHCSNYTVGNTYWINYSVTNGGFPSFKPNSSFVSDESL